MSLFVIADLHLSFGCNKPMDVFSGLERLYTAIGTKLAQFGKKNRIQLSLRETFLGQ